MAYGRRLTRHRKIPWIQKNSRPRYSPAPIIERFFSYLPFSSRFKLATKAELNALGMTMETLRRDHAETRNELKELKEMYEQDREELERLKAWHRESLLQSQGGYGCIVQ
jgi:hypothetical protein